MLDASSFMKTSPSYKMVLYIYIYKEINMKTLKQLNLSLQNE
jgi:hypothetical protein